VLSSQNVVRTSPFPQAVFRGHLVLLCFGLITESCYYKIFAYDTASLDSEHDGTVIC